MTIELSDKEAKELGNVLEIVLSHISEIEVSPGKDDNKIFYYNAGFYIDEDELELLTKLAEQLFSKDNWQEVVDIGDEIPNYNVLPFKFRQKALENVKKHNQDEDKQ